MCSVFLFSSPYRCERNYVYVEGDNGIREAKWVTVGLEGNDYAEIVEGLEEGDLIIVK